MDLFARAYETMLITSIAMQKTPIRNVSSKAETLCMKNASPSGETPEKTTAITAAMIKMALFFILFFVF